MKNFGILAIVLVVLFGAIDVGLELYAEHQSDLAVQYDDVSTTSSKELSMRIMTRSELAGLLFDVKGSSFVTLLATTDQSKLLKGGKSNPLYGLEKHSLVNGLINWNYTNSVNAQRGREAEVGECIEAFVAEPRSWGYRLHDKLTLRDGRNRLLPLVAKNTNRPVSREDVLSIPVSELYLEFKPENELETRFFLNEKEVSESEAYAAMRPKREGQRQEVEKIVRVRDYALNSIHQITLQGQTYNLVA